VRMMLRLVGGMGLVLAVLAIGSVGTATPVARADLPVGCPPAPTGLSGNTLYKVTATAPAGGVAPYNGVCITLIGTGGENVFLRQMANPAGCPVPTPPAVGAQSNAVWADWGTGKCAAAGSQVVILFKSSPFLCPGPGTCVQNNAATWVGSTAQSDATIERVNVGGIAEGPGLAGTSAGELGASDGGSGWSTGAYAALAAGLAALAVALSTGAWYARRRWLS